MSEEQTQLTLKDHSERLAKIEGGEPIELPGQAHTRQIVSDLRDGLNMAREHDKKMQAQLSECIRRGDSTQSQAIANGKRIDAGAKLFGELKMALESLEQRVVTIENNLERITKCGEPKLTRDGTWTADSSS